MKIAVQRLALIGGAFLAVHLAFQMVVIAFKRWGTFSAVSPQDHPFADVFLPASCAMLWLGFAWALTPRFRGKLRFWPIAVAAISAPTAILVIYITFNLAVYLRFAFGLGI